MNPLLFEAISSISLVIWLFLLANWFIWRRQVAGSPGRFGAKSRAMIALYPSLAQLVMPALRDAILRDTSNYTYLAAGLSTIVWLMIHRDLTQDDGDHYFTNWRERFGIRRAAT